MNKNVSTDRSRTIAHLEEDYAGLNVLELGGPMKVLKIEFVYEDFDTRFAL